jgi:hypothetical protein
VHKHADKSEFPILIVKIGLYILPDMGNMCSLIRHSFTDNHPRQHNGVGLLTALNVVIHLKCSNTFTHVINTDVFKISSLHPLSLALEALNMNFLL